MSLTRFIIVASFCLSCLIICRDSEAQTRRPTETSRPTSTKTVKPVYRRIVTVNLKEGAPVTGNFIGADADNIQVEVAGNKLNIKLDEIVTLVFAPDLAAKLNESPSVPDGDKGAAANDALRSLRKLAGATEVGITFQEYGTRLIDIKNEVDEALSKLPEGETKSEINLAMQAYVDAGQAWNRTLGKGGRYSEASLFPDSDPWANQLQKTYNIPVEVLDPGKNVPDHLRKTAPPGALDSFRFMRQSVVLTTIWKAARDKIDSVTASITK